MVLVFFCWLRNKTRPYKWSLKAKLLQNASYLVRKCDMLKENRHYLWSQKHKISKKQLLDFIQQIWFRVVYSNLYALSSNESECFLLFLLHKDNCVCVREGDIWARRRLRHIDRVRVSSSWPVPANTHLYTLTHTHTHTHTHTVSAKGKKKPVPYIWYIVFWLFLKYAHLS